MVYTPVFTFYTVINAVQLTIAVLYFPVCTCGGVPYVWSSQTYTVRLGQ